MLERLQDGEAILMRWPPTNGGFVMGFNRATARRIKREGFIVLDGKRAIVTPASMADDDERVDFYFGEEEA